MFIEERFLVMDEAPFAHDTSATAHDAAQTFVGQMDVMQTDAGMDSKVVYTLFALFNKGVLVDFPSQVFHFAVYLLQCLVDGYSAYRYRTITDNPFACFVDVVTGRQVHQGIASPLTAPYGFVHFFFDA